jgi:hypothetical protein
MASIGTCTSTIDPSAPRRNRYFYYFHYLLEIMKFVSAFVCGRWSMKKVRFDAVQSCHCQYK